jgi:hypothetical protein
MEREPKIILTISIGILSLLIFAFFYFISTGERAKWVKLTAKVELTGNDALLIENKDSFQWDNLRLSINGDYKTNKPALKSGAFLLCNLKDFTKKDGTRFNILSTKPLEFSIICQTEHGTGSYLGTWE